MEQVAGLNTNILRLKNMLATYFLLDANTKFTLHGPSSKDDSFIRWRNIVHCDDKRIALNLIVGDVFKPDKVIQIDRDTKLYVSFTAGLPVIDDSGLILDLCFIPLLGSAIPLAFIPLSGGPQTKLWHQFEMDISFLYGMSGSIVVSVKSNLNNESTPDILAISDLCIARVDRLSLIKASSHHQLRVYNEMQHFSSVYRHNMYISNKKHNSRQLHIPIIRKIHNRSIAPSTRNIEDMVSDIEVQPNESVYDFTHRLLSAYLHLQAPDFFGRLKERAAGGSKIRILSICSGAARIEASYAAELGDNVEWSLFDINADLLCMAASQFPKNIKVDLIEGDVNELVETNEKWDIIMCISALHHVVELENVIRFCNKSLKDDGEFWSIGEYVGRNGNRLWPDTRIAANKIFSQLPESKRVNLHTNNIDVEIPDNDFSVGCFEGIRSEDIEPLIARWFKADEIMKRNCFLWRLVNLAYADNYDLNAKEDLDLLKKIVYEEIIHFIEGGQATELFAVYRPISRCHNHNDIV